MCSDEKYMLFLELAGSDIKIGIKRQEETIDSKG